MKPISHFPAKLYSYNAIVYPALMSSFCQVLTTFGLHFKITPLLEAIGRWFKSVLNAEFFGKTISMIYKLKKLGFSEDELTDKLLLIPAMMEFVNNSSRKEFTNLLSDNFNELDLVVLKVLFNGENNHLDILLHTLIDRITSEDECEVILGFLERLLYSKEAEVVYVFSREVGSIIEQIENITSSSKNLGTSVRLFAELKRKSDTEFGTPHGISLELLQRTRCWREYSLRHLKSLKDNKNLKSWHVAEIYLDWIEIHEPSKDDFNELHQIVFDTLDADIEKCPYPQLYRYRYDIDGYFKRLSPKKCGDKSFCQRLTDFIKPALGFLFSNLNSIALVVVISWYWLMEPSKSLLAVNGGRVIITLFILNFCKPLFFGAKQFFQRWNVKISVREKNVQKLAASTLTPIRVKTYSSEGSIIRLLPLFYSDVQLENYHGTGKLKIENCCWKKDCNIKHWYIKSSFTKADGSFCSVFTHSHKEIVTFLTQQHEQLPKSISSRIYREIAYFVFGWSPISLFTINYD